MIRVISNFYVNIWLSALVHSVSKSSSSVAQKPERLLMRRGIFCRSFAVVKPTQALDSLAICGRRLHPQSLREAKVKLSKRFRRQRPYIFSSLNYNKNDQAKQLSTIGYGREPLVVEAGKHDRGQGNGEWSASNGQRHGLTPVTEKVQAEVLQQHSVAVLGKNIWGAWPLIIWEAKRNYYRTN